MPRCPICGEDLEYLYLIYSMTCQDAVYYNEHSDELEYEEDEAWPEGADEYKCPECNETLFEHEDDAFYFLKTGKIPEHLIPRMMERKLER